MIQLIGLIVSAYALARLIQIPLEMGVSVDSIFGTPKSTRYMIAVVVSVVGVCVVALLTVAMLVQGERLANP